MNIISKFDLQVQRQLEQTQTLEKDQKMTTCEVPDLFSKNNTAANILRSSEKESVKEKLVLFQHFPNLSI